VLSLTLKDVAPDKDQFKVTSKLGVPSNPLVWGFGLAVKEPIRT
jgi:hypothetical protein